MQELIKTLQQIAAKAGGATSRELLPLVQSAKKAAQNLKQDQLVQELGAWESKLDVILKEPIGRQGMSRHAAHWVERLQK